MNQLSLFGDVPRQKTRREADRYEIHEDRWVINREDGEIIEIAEAAARLPWTDSLPGGGMPPHQYLVFGGQPNRIPRGMDRRFVDVLLSALRNHPDAYDAFFRGYRYPNRYLELSDDRRYWRTALGGTHMLNRCTLDSVEPPRRVDEGATALEWDGPPWAPFGSPWPPGYTPLGGGKYRYDAEQDWRRRHRCVYCGAQFFLSAPERPCPRCRQVQRAEPGLL